ncbi:hypothetical protein PPYR_02202 [Photinus pyralis]|uniref:Nuclease HARBI1 n=1 Tax=Photinus pyralis TaxID=7054 RepID=A0A5N4B6L6_PHOPY|nr:hypothetical protein PPYR_02202 [Photinus pyralis]
MNESYYKLSHFRFRLSKAVASHLLNYIREAIESPSNRGGAINGETKLLLTLRFYATGNILQSVGDFVGISVASASRIVKTVTHAIASLK